MNPVEYVKELAKVYDRPAVKRARYRREPEK